MVYFINNNENLIFRFCFLCYAFGFVIFMNGLLSPTDVNLESIPMGLLLKECPTTVEQDLCSLQNSLHMTQYSNHRSKIVIIIIDALRTDFIPSIKKNHKFNVSMDFTEKLLSNGKAISFVTQGFAPTVTLPRIKTLVTGTISNFLDIIINFSAVELTADNILKQAGLHGLKSIFYGDDTWIKLFPNTFIREEGTHSFFVSDFTEVDHNVSRHIHSELSNIDWNIMVLHFLGVDHIGHAYSPFSKHLPKKLHEMDEVIKLTYENLKSNEVPSLIIVCGDHGMTTSGSHGGITQDELLTPLIFIDTANHKALPVKSLDIIDQVDFAPTLSAVLGIPIPASSFGNIIPNVLEFVGFSSEEIMFAEYYNFLQLSKVYKKTFSRETSNLDLVKETTANHLKWLKNSDKMNKILSNSEYIHILKSYNTILNKMKMDLLNTISGYNEFSMICGIMIMWITLVFSFYILCPLSIDKCDVFSICLRKTKYSIIMPFIIVFLIYYERYLEIILIPLFTLLLLAFYSSFILISYGKDKYLIKNYGKVSFFFLIIHAVSLFSSSYIEEEHQTWYFLSVTIVILLCVRKFYYLLHFELKNTDPLCKHNFKWVWNNCSTSLCYMFAFLILHRISRKWNQVGNKWQDLPDISDWLSEKENAAFLVLFIVISQIIFLSYFRKYVSSLNYVLFCSGIVCIFFQKLPKISIHIFLTTYTISVLIPWIVYLIITLMMALTFLQLYSRALNSNTEKVLHLLVNFVSQWILLIEIIGRAHNIPLIAIILIQEYILSRVIWTQDCDKITNSICYLIMAKTSFFYYGNSNSFSTIDVFTGYTGIQYYMPFVVAFLLICNTYSTLVLWLILLSYRIIKIHCNEDFKDLIKKIKLIFLFLLDYKLLILSLYSIVMYMMRHHLFIYSVFFPKLFYELCFVLCFSIIYLLISIIIHRA